MRDGWADTTLGDVVELGKGGAWGADEMEPNRVEAVCLRGTDLADLIDKKHPEAPVRWLTPTELKKAVCAPNMVLIETSGSKCGRSVVLTVEMLSRFELPVVYSNFCRTLSIDTRLVSSRYVEMWFSHKYEAGVIPSYRATSAMPNLDVKSLLRMETIAVPPLVEQKRIVDVVSSVDAYIDALQQQADTARTARNAVLHELLESVSSAPQKKLKDLTSKIGSGATPRGGEAVYQESGVSLIRSQNVHNGRFLHEGLVSISDSAASALDGVSVEVNDVLINITGASVARACMVDASILPARVNQHVAILRTDSNQLLPGFLLQILLGKKMNSYLLDISGSGTTRQAITKAQLEDLEVSIPPLVEQKRIVEIVSSMDDVIRTTEQAVVDAKNLRSGLLSDLLSGEHEIPASYDVLVGAA